ncbi:MAG TPA: class I SAM-dependent methyltransferase [Candidatus Thermoplasmatota archaeon]|nr:class I SAM-dependent methyltransferase [Candidatus Thermoplasmatota archaeon]
MGELSHRLVLRVKRIAPPALWRQVQRGYYGARRAWFDRFGRPVLPRETSKARERRLREGFFDKYCRGQGIDIGCAGDVLAPNCRGWDLEDGDAHHLAGAPDASYDFAYSSHTLEHMEDPALALRNWWRVVKPGGFLLLYVPDRDLYEKKRTLPSRWNDDHKHYFLLDRDDPPDTIGLLPLVERTLAGFEVLEARRCDEGHTIRDPDRPSDGEYSIEIVLRKRA